jgi:hypothetical protein
MGRLSSSRDNRSMHLSRASRVVARSAVAGALAAALAACSPALDWREARADGVVAMFPCRPHQQERQVSLAGSTVPMRMHACTAAGSNFSLAALDVADPAAVGSTLAALRTQLLANVSGAATDERPFAVPGATPNPQSLRLHIVGKRPDGSPVVADTGFFVKGLRLYQAAVLGNADAARPDAVDMFFGAFRLP